MTSNSDFPFAKKRGRPLGSKNKRKVARKVAGKSKSFKQPDDSKLLEKILKTEFLLDQEAVILNLEHQVIGYKAVISYLEHKLGTK
jgi:hypothetical protein